MPNIPNVSTTFSDLHIPLGQKKLEYQGEDIFFKLTKGESRQVTIESAPVLALGADGQQYDTKRYKIGLRNDWITGIVSRKYTFVANEVAYKLVNDAGFKPTNVHFSKSGNAMFIEVFNDGLRAIGGHHWSNDGQNGDDVNVGVLVRNSIDGTASFGGDIFTYRSRCSNGSIIGKKQLGSFSVKHIGEYNRLLSVFRQYLDRAFRLSKQVKSYYQKAAEVKVNQEIAEAFVKTHIPQKFLPDFIQVDEGKVFLQDKSTTVWDAFNESTEKVWHLEKLGIGSKVTYTQRANTWLLQTVEPLVVK